MKFSGQLGLLLVLGVLIGAAGGAVGGFFLARVWNPWPAPELPGTQGERLRKLDSFAQIRNSPPPNAVAALGRLEPSGRVVDIGGMMGERLASLDVKEGATVTKGKVLGYLDTYTVRLAQREAAAAQLVDAKKRLAAELASADALINEAQIGVRQAEKLDPLDIEAQEAKVRLLTSEGESARTDLQRMKDTLPGTVSVQKMDEQAQGVRRAHEELLAAKATLAKACAGHELNLERARAQLALAQAGRHKAEASAQIASLTKNVELAQAELERSILKAPSDGVILQILARPGEKVDQMPILKMGDTRVMYVRAEIYETDLPLVQPGQTASISSRALPRVLKGTVERVGRFIARNQLLHVDPAADADARVGEAWIRLEKDAGVDRLTNLQVDVVIDRGSAAPGS